MKRQALFFDIDGTLFSEIDRQVPHSAVLALKKTRENGHLVFINTGRTYCQTKGIRKEIEHDGLLCGCGTYIIADDIVLYDREIPPARRVKLKRDIEKYNLEGALEGVKGCSLMNQKSRFPDVEGLKAFLKSEGAFAQTGWEDDSFTFSKFCVLADEKSDTEGFFETLEDFEVIDRGGGFYECIPNGHSKATAMEMISKRYGIQREDVWAFGDSMNDLLMLQYAPNAVVMERHDAELEPFATFVTKAVEADGIEFALRTFGII